MSRPRLSIRRKLLGLLALFSLCPLLLLAYFDHRAFDRVGASLAEEWGASLSSQARRGLALQADTGALLLAHAIDRLAFSAQTQARLVARELASPLASPAVASAEADADQADPIARVQALGIELAALRDALGLADSRQEVRLSSGLGVQFPASQEEFPGRAGPAGATAAERSWMVRPRMRQDWPL